MKGQQYCEKKQQDIVCFSVFFCFYKYDERGLWEYNRFRLKKKQIMRFFVMKREIETGR